MAAEAEANDQTNDMGGCPGQEPAGPEAAWSNEQLRKINEHPCYSREASHTFGRMHLPVAPRCNVQCNFCMREFDCVNESRPGVTSKVLKPEEALEKVTEVIERHPFIKVIGIAGPGDPLFNDATFATLALIKERFPNLIFCLSTNGLFLPQKMDALQEAGVGNLTVTVNAVDPAITEQIYSFVYAGGDIIKGRQAAEILIENQLLGIAEAVKRGMIVKVNTVMIPTVNDHHLIEIAKKASELGAYMQNIMPLIAQYKFGHIVPPTPAQRSEAQAECGKLIRQMRHCRQCRADAVGLLSQDLSRNIYGAMQGCAAAEVAITQDTAKEEHGNTYKVAVATSGTSDTVDLHFGHARQFHIYRVDPTTMTISFDTVRTIDDQFCGGPECDTQQGQQELLVNILNLLRDCRYLLCRRIGLMPANWLKDAGIEVMEDYDRIEDAIRRVVRLSAST